MLPYRSIRPLLYVAVLSLCTTALAFELYIFVLFRGYGGIQTDAVGIVLAIAALMTLIASILVAWLWLLKRAPNWVKRLKQNEAMLRAEHSLTSRSANDYVRQHIQKNEKRSDDFPTDS